MPNLIDSVGNGILNSSISLPVAAMKKTSEDQPNTKALRVTANVEKEIRVALGPGEGHEMRF